MFIHLKEKTKMKVIYLLKCNNQIVKILLTMSAAGLCSVVFINIHQRKQESGRNVTAFIKLERGETEPIAHSHRY